MACMEHTCTKCEWWTMNNRPSPILCPKCGSRVMSTCDEVPEREEWDEPF